MMKFRVVLVPFPFDDLSGSKTRPAICLTKAIGVHGHVVVAFITSVIPAQLEPSDLVLNPSDADFASTGLKVRSVLRLHRVVTIPKRIIQRQLGVFTPPLQGEIANRLRSLFAL